MILILVAAAFAGCSGIPETPAAPAEQSQSAQEGEAPGEQTQESNENETLMTAIEPEQLLSTDDVSALLGEPVMDAQKSQMESVGQKIALYDPVEDGSFAFLQISLSQQSSMPAGSSITPSEIYESAKKALDETSDLAVSGIGDDCFSGTPGLHILYRGYYIVIGAGNTNDEAVQAILIEAGKLAVVNLGELL